MTTKSSLGNGYKLWRAAKAGQLPRVKFLLKSGADIQYRCEEAQTTPLHQAALAGNTDILDLLLEAGSSVDDEDREGATALHYAARRDVVISLIAAGADVDYEDSAGRTPGCRAHERSDIGVVDVLLNNHADPTKIPTMIGNGHNGRTSRQSSQNIEQGMLTQHEELYQMPDRTTAGLGMLLMTDNLPNLGFGNTGPERKLVIGIVSKI